MKPCEVCIDNTKPINACIDCAYNGGKYWNFEPIQPTLRKLTEKEFRNWFRDIMAHEFSHTNWLDKVLNIFLESGVQLNYIEPKKKTALEEARDKFKKINKYDDYAENVYDIANVYITELEKAINEMKNKKEGEE